jgi:glycosyltransferase involved in cell wall biosynthesis
MNILYLIYDHPENPWVGGGGAVRVYEIARRLSTKGHKITVLSGKFPGAENYSENGLSYRFVGRSINYIISTFSYAMGASGFVRRYGKDYDIIIEDFAPWNPVFSRFLAKRPTVLHLNHREGLNMLKRWPVIGLPFFLLEKYYPRLFRNITALSEGTKRKIGIPGTVVVPAGISAGTITNESAVKDELFILYVGRLHIKNKGLDTLITALKRLGGIKLRFAGRGPDEEKLREMAKGLDVEFLGFVNEESKLDLLKRAGILVLPSRFEGWGIVVLEAAACGTASVVSDIPELAFSVDGGFGVSFRTEDPGDLADKLQLLLTDKSLREEMGVKARQYVKSYTWERITDEFETYLEGIAAKK